MGFIIRSGVHGDMSSVWSLINELAVFEREPDAVKINVVDLIENGFKKNPGQMKVYAVYSIGLKTDRL